MKKTIKIIKIILILISITTLSCKKTDLNNFNYIPEVSLKSSERISDLPTPARITTNLESNINNNWILCDGFLASYNTGNCTCTNDDITKMMNFGENIWLLRDNANLVIELRPLVPRGSADTLFVRTSNLINQQPYRLKLNITNWKNSQMWLNIRLYDKYEVKKCNIDLINWQRFLL